MAAQTLESRIEALQEDEKAIIEVLLDRIEQGRKEYGPWKVNDGRDYRGEAFDEVIDALHYCAAALVKKSQDCKCADRCQEKKR
jgi:hypothetical protein